jgi:hypothetical protein
MYSPYISRYAKLYLNLDSVCLNNLVCKWIWFSIFGTSTVCFFFFEDLDLEILKLIVKTNTRFPLL